MEYRWEEEYESLVRRLTRATAPAALQQGFDDPKLNREADAEAKKDWKVNHAQRETRDETLASSAYSTGAPVLPAAPFSP